jgi:hypothetical protein
LLKATATSSARSKRRAKPLSALTRESAGPKAFQAALTKAHGGALRAACQQVLKAVAGVA